MKQKIELPSRQAKDRIYQVVKQKIKFTKLSSKRSSCQSLSRVHAVTSETVELHARFRLGAEGLCLVDKQKSWQALTWKGRVKGKEGGGVGGLGVGCIWVGGGEGEGRKG